MHCPVYFDPTVQTTFSVTTLDKATRTADNAINWQPDIISIRKDTFHPVVNLKGGIAYWATGFTRLRINTLVQAEWAGYVFVALRHIFFEDLIHPLLTCKRLMGTGQSSILYSFKQLVQYKKGY
jgi:hypothetical protein